MRNDRYKEYFNFILSVIRIITNLDGSIVIMILKILNSILIIFAVFMGLKQGWAMLSAKPEMMEIFGKWNFDKTGVMIMGAITMLSAILILFPKTFIWGIF